MHWKKELVSHTFSSEKIHIRKFLRVWVFALDFGDQSQERLKEIAARSLDRLSPHELKEVPEKKGSSSHLQLMRAKCIFKKYSRKHTFQDQTTKLGFFFCETTSPGSETNAWILEHERLKVSKHWFSEEINIWFEIPNIYLSLWVDHVHPNSQ